MIRYLLWDIDGTLLDFKAAENYGIRKCFALMQMGLCSDEMLARYSAINHAYWQKLERGEMTKPEILIGRFETFFKEEGLPVENAPRFNELYQYHLGDAAFFMPGGEEAVRYFKGRMPQYAATNGTALAQERKLAKSGLDQLLDGIFISEEIGFEKPDPRFFEVFFEKTGTKPEEGIIIGDSLSSDMLGGTNAGLLRCYYAPGDTPLPPEGTVDYVIRHLGEVPALVEKINGRC